MDAVEPRTRAGGSLYAWVIVLAAFLCFGVVFGTVTYSFTVFVNPIAKAFGLTPTKVVLGFSLLNIGTGVLGIFAGRLLARFSIRNVMVGGLVLLAAGFFALSLVSSIWQFYLAYSLIVALGSAIVAPMGASAIVTNWFAANRGRALTMATLGTSFGQLLIPPFAAGMIESGGWESAYRAFAVLMLVVAVPIAFLVVDHPAKRGLLAHGAEAATPQPVGDSHKLMSNTQILRRADFWVILFSYLLTVVVYLGLVATIVPYARTFGVTAVQAAQLTMTMGIAAIAGKVGFATFTDRMGLRNTFWIAIGLNLTALILLSFVHGYPVLFAASACIGASAGGVLPVWPGLVAFRFGPRALPQVMGLMSPIVISLQGFGAPLITGLHYHPAFLILIGSLLVSTVLSRNLSKPAA
jgi:MFS family permease